MNQGICFWSLNKCLFRKGGSKELDTDKKTYMNIFSSFQKFKTWRARIFLICRFWIEVFVEVFSNLMLFIFSSHYHNIWSSLFNFLIDY